MGRKSRKNWGRVGGGGSRYPGKPTPALGSCGQGSLGLPRCTAALRVSLTKSDTTTEWVFLVKLFPRAGTASPEHIRTPITYNCLSKMLKWTGWRKILFSHT